MLRIGRGHAPGLATLVAALFLGGCASQSGTVATTRPAEGSNADAAAAPVVLTGATLMTDGGAPRLLLSASGPLAPTVFTRDGGTKVVVDLADATASPGFEPPRPDRSLLSKVEMRSFTEMGRPHVQIELSARVPVESQLGTEPGSNALAVSFRRIESRDEVVATAAPAERGAKPVAAGPEPIRVENLPDTKSASADRNPTRSEPPARVAAASRPAAPAASGPAAVPDAPAVDRVAPKGRAATKLTSLAARREGNGVVVDLKGDGSFGYEAFLLQNPPRYVVDLAGVRNASPRKTPETSGAVTRVRVAQFKTDPTPVTRVVFDLRDEQKPSLVSREGTLAVRFDSAPAAVRAAAPAAAPAAGTPPVTAAAAPSAGSYERHETEDPDERVVEASKPSAPAPASDAAPVEVRKAAVAPVVEDHGAPRTADASKGEPANAATEAVRVAPSPEPQVVAATPEVRVAPLPSAEAPRAPRRKASAENRALVEAAEALLNQQDTASRTKDLANPFESRALGAGDKQYTGEPITLNLKDADIKDTLQKFSELTGLNIVLDPEVRGTVTVSLTDIPWDQALELILKINGLGYVLEGNIMRIAPTPKLSREESERQALVKAQDQNRPVKTVIRKLSYSNASDTANTARKVMSARGDIFVDGRSNTLIIKELPDYLPTVLDLINNLDAATPQVMIEARIVEATRQFQKQLGIDWGFSGVADAAHGNTTGLVFPNSGAVTGNVSLPSGTPLIGMNFANVLDTFRLDMTLSAAESRGLLKVVSSPKVQTQTNQEASIQSGFQIPVQTSVNNTTSVLYVDATLRLDVTPQITAEGTVILDIKVQKREPAVSLNIAGGQNIPLVTRDAKTKLMVRDGGTAVIGGVFKLTTNDQQSMVPSLWKIPILGYLFRNRTGQENADELMIFITPRIIKN